MLVPHLSDKEYHSKPHLSSHQLKEFMRSPAHYKALFERKHKASKAMEIGTCIHMALLEPDRFESSLNYEESCDRKSKAGKELYDQWLQALKPDDIVVSGRTSRPVELDNIIITARDVDNLRGMQRAYYKHGWVSQVHTDGSEHQNELSVFQEFEGVSLRSRFDKVIDGRILVDLKKTQDANPNTWKYDFKRYGYGYQMAFYRFMFYLEYGQYPEHVVVVAIEENYPHAVVAYEIPSWDLDSFEDTVIQGIRRFKECFDADTWPSYCDDGLQLLTLD